VGKERPDMPDVLYPQADVERRGGLENVAQATAPRMRLSPLAP
jgi:hypothetical protein